MIVFNGILLIKSLIRIMRWFIVYFDFFMDILEYFILCMCIIIKNIFGFICIYVYVN